MRVKRLTIRSFRGIDDLTLEFDPIEPTVLIGINGVGKSSILDCLVILLSPFIGFIQASDEERYEARNYGDDEQLSPILSFHNQDTKIGNRQIQGEIEISYNPYAISWVMRSLEDEHIDDSNPYFPKHINSALKLVSITGKIRQEWRTNSKANIPIGVYYPVNRAVLNASLEAEVIQLNQVDAYSQSLSGGRVNFDHFFEWFRSLEDLENEERRDVPEHRDRRLEAVRDAIRSMVSDFSDLRVRRFPLRVTARKQEQELTFDQLSDGEKGLLALVGDLARRLAIANPGLSDPLQGEGVVLIDEIELHLHPQWQRGIIPKLTQTFPNCQFIATTHSPQVISDVKPNGIYILESTPDGIKARRPESSFGKDSNSILEDLMGVPERPQNIKNELRHLFRLIDEGNLEEARNIQEHLEELIGSDEPEFSRADFLIRRKEILGR